MGIRSAPTIRRSTSLSEIMTSTGAPPIGWITVTVTSRPAPERRYLSHRKLPIIDPGTWWDLIEEMASPSSILPRLLSDVHASGRSGQTARSLVAPCPRVGRRAPQPSVRMVLQHRKGRCRSWIPGGRLRPGYMLTTMIGEPMRPGFVGRASRRRRGRRRSAGQPGPREQAGSWSSRNPGRR